MGALGGSSTAAALPGGAVPVLAGALFGTDGAFAPDSGAFDAASGTVAAGAEASAFGAFAVRAAGAAQPVSPAEGGAPPTINAVAARAHG